MRSAPAILAALGLVLAGCSSKEARNDVNMVEEELPAIPDVVPAKGCAENWAVTVDPASFSTNGAGRTFDQNRLDAFDQSIDDAVKDALDEACKAGEVDAAAAGKVRTLTVVSASGASSPVFAADRPDSLRLEFAFAESDLAIPSQMELRAGLACWTNPRGDQCAQMEP